MEEHAQVQIVTSKSMAVAVTSDIININEYFGYAVQANYTTSGTLVGTLALQASVDHKQELVTGNVTNAGNFVTIPNSAVTLSGAGSYIWNVMEANYSFFRLIYTPGVSDTGTLNAFCTIKG